MEVKTISIDLAKEIFHIFGVNQNNEIVINKKVTRQNFSKLFIKLPKIEIFMEACGGAHHWARIFSEMGHTVKLIAPHHVTPYVGHQKNDKNDAKAILEACRRPEAVFVGAKETWQQDFQSMHKVRDLKLKHQIALINQIRGLMMEYGVVISKSHKSFRENILMQLEDVENNLTDTIRELCFDLYQNYLMITLQLKMILEKISEKSETSSFIQAAQKEIKGVGLLASSRFFASIGNVDQFKNGRQASAWLGLVPKQHSSGGKIKLGRITKHGDSDLRKFIVQGARAAVAGASRKINPDKDELKIRRLVEQKGFNVASVAVANRNTRRMFAILKKYKNEASA